MKQNYHRLKQGWDQNKINESKDSELLNTKIVRSD